MIISLLAALISCLLLGDPADYPPALTPQEAARAQTLADELWRFPDDYSDAAAEIVDRLTPPPASLDREPPPDASTPSIVSVRPYTISGAAVALAAILYAAWRYVSRRRSRGKRETQTRKRQA